MGWLQQVQSSQWEGQCVTAERGEFLPFQPCAIEATAVTKKNMNFVR
jgi:hypothetical protein